jgi:sugar phosphate isomerase/epimerase
MDIVMSEVEAETPEVVREILEHAGLRAGAVSLPVEFRRDERTFDRDFVQLPRLARFAAALGSTTMYRSLPASSERPADELLPILRRRVSMCAEVLREQGMEFAIEVLGPLHRRREGPHEFVWRLSDAATFAEACGHDVGLLVDSWHWHHAGDTIQDIVDVGDRILHVHVADAPDISAEAIRDDQRLLPGEGVVDFAAFFSALDAVGYSGMISPEIRGYRCSRGPVDCARRALTAVYRATA